MIEELEKYWWVRELGKGNNNAYRDFFDQCYKLFASLAYNYVKDESIAEDIVHDVVYEILKKNLNFNNLISFNSFMFTSIKYRSLDYLSHVCAGDNYKRIISQKASYDFFLENVIEQEVYYYLNCAIDELNPATAQVYKLATIGLSNSQIAEKLGISIDSVKSHKKRGRKILAEKLKNLMIALAMFS